MTLQDIASIRLCNQQILQQKFTAVKDLIHWMGAVQAQDYASSFWAIGLRIPNITEEKINDAIKKKEIVRTWPMRGTLHFVAAEDVRWMLTLLTPRVLARAAGVYRLAGLNEAIFKKSRKVLIKVLETNQQLTRKDLYEQLEKAKIATDRQRGLHILGYWAQQGLICLGPHQGKQPSFVLLDEWLPKTKELKKDEALAELANRYFNSHGPATIQDFAWWSGLTLTDAKKGLEDIKQDLQMTTIDQQDYWMHKDNLVEKVPSSLHLLPSFDEYLVAYKNRSAAFDQKFLPQIVSSGNGIFNPVILINGRVAGTWKRNSIKDKMQIEVKPFTSFNKSHEAALKKVAQQYGRFSGKETDFSIAKPGNVNLS